MPSGQETISDLACQPSLVPVREPESCSEVGKNPVRESGSSRGAATQTDVAVELMEVVEYKEKQPFTWSNRSTSPFCWLGCAYTYADDLMLQPTPNRSA